MYIKCTLFYITVHVRHTSDMYLRENTCICTWLFGEVLLLVLGVMQKYWYLTQVQLLALDHVDPRTDSFEHVEVLL